MSKDTRRLLCPDLSPSSRLNAVSAAAQDTGGGLRLAATQDTRPRSRGDTHNSRHNIAEWATVRENTEASTGRLRFTGCRKIGIFGGHDNESLHRREAPRTGWKQGGVRGERRNGSRSHHEPVALRARHLGLSPTPTASNWRAPALSRTIGSESSSGAAGYRTARTGSLASRRPWNRDANVLRITALMRNTDSGRQLSTSSPPIAQ